MVQDSYSYNGRPTVGLRRIWSVDRRHFQWSWTTHNPHFKVTPVFDAEYVVYATRDTHLDLRCITSKNLHTPYRHCNFEWPWTTLSELHDFSSYKQAVLVLPTPSNSSAVCVKVL